MNFLKNPTTRISLTLLFTSLIGIFTSLTINIFTEGKMSWKSPNSIPCYILITLIISQIFYAIILYKWDKETSDKMKKFETFEERFLEGIIEDLIKVAQKELQTGNHKSVEDLFNLVKNNK